MGAGGGRLWPAAEPPSHARPWPAAPAAHASNTKSCVHKSLATHWCSSPRQAQTAAILVAGASWGSPRGPRSKPRQPWLCRVAGAPGPSSRGAWVLGSCPQLFKPLLPTGPRGSWRPCQHLTRQSPTCPPGLGVAEARKTGWGAQAGRGRDNRQTGQHRLWLPDQLRLAESRLGRLSKKSPRSHMVWVGELGSERQAEKDGQGRPERCPGDGDTLIKSKMEPR